MMAIKANVKEDELNLKEAENEDMRQEAKILRDELYHKKV